MGLGILEDKVMAHVPGTILLNDEAAHSEAITGGLKHGTGRNAHIVLAPQPSEDPNDPLNWSSFKKESVFYILCFGAMLNAATIGPLLNSSIVVIAVDLQPSPTLLGSITDIVVVSGYNLLAVGCSGPFYCAFSRKYGKRPVFLWSGLMAIIGCAIGQASNTYQLLLACRIIQGFSTSAFESLIIAAVGDMFFVHQRGFRISFINFVLNACSNIASIICGQITAKLGWIYLFHILQAFTSFQFLLMVFFVPETSYLRDHAYDIDELQVDNLEKLAATEHKREAKLEAGITRTTSAASAVPAKKTYVQTLAIYTGVYTSDQIWRLVFAPFVTLLNPGACYSTIANGTLTTFYVGIAIVVAGVFSGAPWALNTSEIGYMSAGPFVGGCIGSLIISVLSDPAAKWMTKKNRGVFEPEMRLLFLIPAVVCCAIGMFLFGYEMSIGASAVTCSTMWGFMMCGVLLGTTAVVSYALDAYRESSNELFIMNMLFKNFLFYGFSNFVNNWYFSVGPMPYMSVFGGVSVGLCLLGLPVYIFGKRLRSWWSRHNLLVLFGMQASRQEAMG